ncbi:hypothetical protein HFP57_16065 [Parasphingopyxis algicola]|uniref:phytanoyl-CoA dioxygenase family protein n=1 Tax=Parasphingopyxis algicola TaxID=2026624 RepID=UPI0015A3E9F7|nr:phytanoyl-CoA dioxygenase family protein [Parasphingopyxis algicola]QLC26395.1 hypothetical protein HFP57_16065 [Parasphingopyxis algicola]
MKKLSRNSNSELVDIVSDRIGIHESRLTIAVHLDRRNFSQGYEKMQSEKLQKVTAEHRETYERDGIVFVKGAFDNRWIELLLSGLRRIQNLPDEQICDLPDSFLENDPLLQREIESIKSSSAAERSHYTEQSKGFIRYKYMYWWAPEFRSFIQNSTAAETVADVIGATSLRFFVDAIFLKEAQCSTKTYWHADEPAWPVRGAQVPTMWMPLLPVDAKLSSLEYIAGSHREQVSPQPWPNTFNAKMADQPSDRPNFYDWEERRDDPDVRFIAFDMEPGDVVILHPNMQHGGGANLHPTQPRIAYSTRWFGDDVVWDPRPECVNTPGMPLDKMPKGKPVDQDDIFPVICRRDSSTDQLTASRAG